MNYLGSSGHDGRPLGGSRQAGFITVTLDLIREEFTEPDGIHSLHLFPLNTILFVRERSK